MKNIPILLAILLLIVLPATAQTGVTAGEIIYLEGQVDIYRDGKIIDWRRVDIGFTVEQYDLIETKADGIVEIALTGPSGGSSTIIVKPNTAFALEQTETAGRKENSFQMMKGSMAVRVQRLAATEGVSVRTESVVMGVRGTSFEIIVSVEGGVLITSDEGKVSCKDPQGREVFAEPGAVVENVPEKPITRVAIAVEDIPLYQQFWASTREEIFKAGAETFIRGYSRQYRTYLPRYRDAYRELSAQRRTLERYGRIDSDAPMGTIIRAKGEVSPAIVKMRSILPLFEMVYFRLQDLQRYHAQGYGRGMVEPGLSTDQFFNSFSRESEQMNILIADTRYLLKLYFILHEASGGGPSILDAPFGGGSMFEGGPPVGSPPGGGIPEGGFRPPGM